MSKIDVLWAREKNPLLARSLGLSANSFKIVYFGSMGRANGMEYFIDAAQLLKDYKDLE